MKKVFTFLCIIASGLVHAQISFSADELLKIVKEEKGAYAGSLFHTDAKTNANYEVKWYRCCWNIDPGINEISGNVTTLFTPVTNDFDSLVFDLNQALTVDSVTYHSLQVIWQHAADLLTIHFPSVIPQLVADSLTVYYHGVPPENGFGSFVQSTHNGTPVIWTLSEPYGASDWWPCKNGLTGKADSIDIFIRTPSAYKSASNGLLISANPSGPYMIYHWKHRYPIAAYLVCLAVTNYASYLEQVPFGNDTLKVVNFVYPEDSASAAAQTGIIVSMIQLFDTLFGVYPFQNEKYGHAQFGWGGGMEHQTMTFVTSFGFELLAHELAHQWYGDKITCGSWADIWLNEGFATYLSGLCYEHLAPEFWKRFREVRIQSIVSKPGGSVYCTDTTNIDRLFDSRLSYSKGAMILHQLRWILGDSVFFAAMNNYLNDFRLAYGFARTENFISHLESSSGQDLGWYFDEWFTGEGFPSYQINWSQTSDTVSFTMQQTQSHPSVAFFTLPVQLKFKNATFDTLIRVNNIFSGQLFSVNIPFAVDSVIFDPDFQIISGNNLVNAVNEQAMEAGIQVYPNPATGYVYFHFGGSRCRENGKIRIYDPEGRIRNVIPLLPGQTELPLSISSYVPGLYFYDITRGNFNYKGKFIVIEK